MEVKALIGIPGYLRVFVLDRPTELIQVELECLIRQYYFLSS
jgi:hypothetical protein